MSPAVACNPCRSSPCSPLLGGVCWLRRLRADLVGNVVLMALFCAMMATAAAVKEAGAGTTAKAEPLAPSLLPAAAISIPDCILYVAAEAAEEDGSHLDSYSRGNECRDRHNPCSLRHATELLRDGLCYGVVSPRSPAELRLKPGKYEMPCVRSPADPQVIELTVSVIITTDFGGTAEENPAPSSADAEVLSPVVSPERASFVLSSVPETTHPSPCTFSPLVVRAQHVAGDWPMIVVLEEVDFQGNGPFLSDRAVLDGSAGSLWGNVTIRKVSGSIVDQDLAPIGANDNPLLYAFDFSLTQDVAVVESSFHNLSAVLRVAENKTKSSLGIGVRSVHWENSLLLGCRGSGLHVDVGGSNASVTVVGSKFLGSHLELIWAQGESVDLVVEGSTFSHNVGWAYFARANRHVRVVVNDVEFLSHRQVEAVTGAAMCQGRRVTVDYRLVTVRGCWTRLLGVFATELDARVSIVDSVFEDSVDATQVVVGGDGNVWASFDGVVARNNRGGGMPWPGGFASVKCFTHHSTPSLQFCQTKCELLIRNSTFERNWAPTAGGAVGIVQGASQDPSENVCVVVHLRDTSWIGNRAEGEGGGALYVSATDPVAYEVVSSTFERNVAAGGNGGAGFVWCHSGGSFAVLDSSFYGNRASYDGGALHVFRGPFLTSHFFAVHPGIGNTTFDGNVAGREGAAIFVHGAVALGSHDEDDFKDVVISECNFSANYVEACAAGLEVLCGSIVMLQMPIPPRRPGGVVLLRDSVFVRNGEYGAGMRLRCVVCVYGYARVEDRVNQWISNFGAVPGISAKYYGKTEDGDDVDPGFVSLGSSVRNSAALSAIFSVHAFVVPTTLCGLSRLSVNVSSLTISDSSGGALLVALVNPRPSPCAFQVDVRISRWQVDRHRHHGLSDVSLVSVSDATRVVLADSHLSFMDERTAAPQVYISGSQSSAIVTDSVLNGVDAKFLNPEVTIQSSVFRNAEVHYEFDGGSLQLQNSIFADGRGIRLVSFGSFTASATTLEGNVHASGFGGAIWAKFSNTTARFSISGDSRLRANFAAEGGGLFLFGNNSGASIVLGDNCTEGLFTKNRAHVGSAVALHLATTSGAQIRTPLTRDQSVYVGNPSSGVSPSLLPGCSKPTMQCSPVHFVGGKVEPATCTYHRDRVTTFNCTFMVPPLLDCFGKLWSTTDPLRDLMPPDKRMALSHFEGTKLWRKHAATSFVEFVVGFASLETIPSEIRNNTLQIKDTFTGSLVASILVPIEISRCRFPAKNAVHCYDVSVRNSIIVGVSGILAVIALLGSLVLTLVLYWRIRRGRNEKVVLSPIASGDPIHLQVFWNRPIGDGAFSSVYEGAMPHVEGEKQRVAVKLFTEEGTSQIPDMSRLVELEHENVVRCYGGLWGESDRYMLALELCDMDLRRFLQKYRKKLTPVDRVDLMVQFCEGMKFLHANGISHRDVKPENIQSKRRGAAPLVVLKIADFGCATGRKWTTVDQDGRPVDLVGTPGYIAPFGHFLPAQEQKEELIALELTDEWSIWKKVPPVEDDADDEKVRIEESAESPAMQPSLGTVLGATLPDELAGMRYSSDGSATSSIASDALQTPSLGSYGSDLGSESNYSLSVRDSVGEDDGEVVVEVVEEETGGADDVALRKKLFGAPVSSTLFANDVYAFGIMMWEIWTGNVAYEKLRATINDLSLFFWACHGEKRRPIWPSDVPTTLEVLAEVCWDSLPKNRPTFSEVLARLRELQRELDTDHRRASLRMPVREPDDESGDESRPLLRNEPSINSSLIRGREEQ